MAGSRRGVTRVASMQWGNSNDQCSYSWLGVNNLGHDLAHNNSNCDPSGSKKQQVLNISSGTKRSRVRDLSLGMSSEYYEIKTGHGPLHVHIDYDDEGQMLSASFISIAKAHRILLAHSPDIASSLDKSRFDMVLVGHTHGGQINLPILNGGWVKNGPTRQYLEGLFHVAGSPMYVNRGIGVTHIPIRIGARPEITHFTFHGG